MKRSRFSEEQIIGVLWEQEAGASGADLCRRHGGCRRQRFMPARCDRRAHAQFSTADSGDPWMNNRGRVS